MLTLDEQIARLADHAEEAATAAAAGGPDGANHGAIELRGTVTDLDARRRRRWTLAAAAAVVLVGAAGVTLAPRWIEPDEPVATVPEVTGPPTFPESTAPRPSRFPVLPADDPREQSVGGGYSGLSFGEPGAPGQPVHSAVAAVGRIVGDEVVEGVAITVWATPIARTSDFQIQSDPVSVHGRTYDVWREAGGSPEIFTFVSRDDPRVEISGVDPSRYLEALPGSPIDSVDVGDLVDFTPSAPPDGWQVLLAPTSNEPFSLQAQIIVPTPGGGEPASVDVRLAPSLPAWVATHRLRRVDVDGVSGWITEDAAYIVFWPLGDGEFASAVSPRSAEEAITLARSVEFVDEATWRERYDVAAPVFAPLSEPAPSATTVPGT